jgi:hypothetical protein
MPNHSINLFFPASLVFFIHCIIHNEGMDNLLVIFNLGVLEYFSHNDNSD